MNSIPAKTFSYPLVPSPQTFLGIPAATEPTKGSVAIFGAVHGTPYVSALDESAGETGPDAVRRAITAASVHIDHWDFDFGGPLLDGKLQAFDLGNITTAHDDAAGNRCNIESVTRAILAEGTVPILIGGDDSVAIPFMRAFDHRDERLHLLQIDAHIDWRDEIGGEQLGYSSTMRRASELSCVASMTQLGIRAVGSARREEVETALAWGSRIVTVAEARRVDTATLMDMLPPDLPLLIHIDCDAIDPSICPGVNALSPGGFAFHEMTALIEAAMHRRRLVGFSIVEFQPQADINDMTATVVGRLVSHVLGHLARATDAA